MAPASLLLCVGWPGYTACFHAQNHTADLLWGSAENSYPIIPLHVSLELMKGVFFQWDAARAGWKLPVCWNLPRDAPCSSHHGGTKQTSCYAALANRSSLRSVCWHGWTNFSVCFLHQDVWNLKNNYIFQVTAYWWSSWCSGQKEVAQEKKYLNFTSAPLEEWQREPFPLEAFDNGVFQYIIFGLSEAQENLKELMI